MRTVRLSTVLSVLVLGRLLAPLPPLAAVDGAIDTSFWDDGRATLLTTLDYEIAALVTTPTDGEVVVVGTRSGESVSRAWYWRTTFDTAFGAACIFDPPGGATQGRALAAAFDPSGRLVVAGSARYGTDRLAVARFLYPDCELDDSFDGDGYYTLDVPNGSEEIRAIEIGASGLAFAGYRNDGTDNDLVVLRLQANGTPVSSFSGNGWLVHDPSGAELDDSARGVHVEAGGRVVVGGMTNYGADGLNADFIAVRFEADGDLDPTFGTGGLARVAFDLGGSSSRYDALSAMAVDPYSGAILLGGQASAISTDDLALARLTADGDPDPTFSGDGRLNLNFGLEDLRVEEILLDGLGRITVAGTSLAFSADEGEEFFAARFLDTGSPDTTFSGNGWTTVGFDLGPTIYVHDRGRAAAFSGGRLVIAGESMYEVGTDRTYALARLHNALVFADGFESGGTRLWSDVVSGPLQLQ